MPADYASLPDREIDALCAERMGWKRNPDMKRGWWAPMPHAPRSPVATVQLDGPGKLIPPGYSTDLNRAAELEGEIEKRGHNFWHKYATALMRVCRLDGDWHLLSEERIAWIAATATARQRCEAFLKTTEESK